MTGGSSQEILVTTSTKDGAGVEGSNCLLSNEKGAWNVTSPGSVAVNRSNNALVIKCVNPPLPEGTLVAPSKTRDAMYANLLVGGLIGVAVDHSSGAGYEYPPRVNVVMGATGAAAMPPEAQPARRAAVHDRRFDLPPTSGFAAGSDVQAVPYPAARKGYVEYVTKPVPKAFVLGDGGAYAYRYNTSAAVQQALDVCRAKYSNCRLYAYDDVVVWTPETTATNIQTSPSVKSAADAPASTPAAVPVVGHKFVVPQASGFASLEDAMALPLVSDKVRERYKHFLTLPYPRAFVISNRGGWRFYSGRPTVMHDALERCLADGAQCWLYAVDNRIAWQLDPAKRTGLDQLQLAR
ncbi:hypothetical protein [Pandoraea terrae]|nr:hypothetical protein [Pandoraea terrae]